MPDGPGDLSGSNFFISCLSSSGVNGAINRGCEMVVCVLLCFVDPIFGKSLRSRGHSLNCAVAEAFLEPFSRGDIFCFSCFSLFLTLSQRSFGRLPFLFPKKN